jgi:carbohydrate-selective porin OprB
MKGITKGFIALPITLAVGFWSAAAAQENASPQQAPRPASREEAPESAEKAGDNATQGATQGAGQLPERLALTNHPKGKIRARHVTVEQPQAVLLKKEPFTYLHNTFRDWLFQYRPPAGRALDLQPEMVFAGQKASRTAEGASGQVNFTYRLGVAWTAWGNDEAGRGVLNFKLEGSRNLGAPRPRNLSDNLGSGLELNGAWRDYEAALSTLWWQLESAGGRLRFDLGKIDLGDFFDENEVAGDETSQFLADSLVNNPAIPFPESALGAHFQFQGRRYSLRAGVAAEARTSGSPFRTARGGQGIGLLQFNLKSAASIGGKEREGNYRFILWGANPKGAGGGGFAISFDQSLTESVAAFVRAGVAQRQAVNERSLPFQGFVSAGLGFTPPRRRDDQLGVAFGRGWSPLNEIGAQTIVEAYWRIQVSHTMQLSPLWQVVAQPATGGRPVVAPGLRLRIAL